MTAREGYIIAAQSALSIEVDEFGDVTLRQDKSIITINSGNLAGLIDILINIDDGRRRYDSTKATVSIGK